MRSFEQTTTTTTLETENECWIIDRPTNRQRTTTRWTENEIETGEACFSRCVGLVSDRAVAYAKVEQQLLVFNVESETSSLTT